MKIHPHTPAASADPIECQQADNIATLTREVATLNKAVWRGNGTPSIMSQLATQKQMLSALCWLVGGTCMAVIGQIVFLFFRIISGH